MLPKHSLETKVKSIKDIVENGMSVNAVRKNLRTSRVTIQLWLAFYERYGIKGLTLEPKTYSGDFKVSVVRYIHEYKMSFFDAAVHFAIPCPKTVSKWDSIYLEKGPEALYKGNRGKIKMTKNKSKNKSYNLLVNKQMDSSEENLAEEVQRLRMENDYLKKLITLAQAKEASPKKTK